MTRQTGKHSSGPLTHSNSHYTEPNETSFIFQTNNSNYYDKSAIKFSEVDYKAISSPSSILAALQAGQLDAAQGDPSTAAAAASAALRSDPHGRRPPEH